MSNHANETNDFQRKFREALERKEINQRKLSEISGVETSSISCYLSGKYMPKPETIKKLALALDVDYEYLMIANDDKEINDFQSKLREAMERKGINQQKLSEISGVEKSGISFYLRGKSIPKPDTIKKLALALDVDYDYLTIAAEKSSTQYEQELEKNWYEYYEIAKQYYETNGNLFVPGKYAFGEKKLGQWIANQRQLYKNQKLSDEKITLLERIGMIWSVSDSQWNKYYDWAVRYFNENHNLQVPYVFIAHDGMDLGTWIRHQRRQYKNGQLSKEKTELLEKIGMVWSVLDTQWYKYYNLAVEYYNNNGDLLVPQRYKTTNNKKLGSWIALQRKSYKDAKLSKERIELLEKIGMAWDGTSAIWNKMYKLAQQYYKENNNLSIADTSFTYHNISLGSWIVTQRNNYIENRLTDKQITLLNKIGMEWVYTNNPDYLWEKNYNTVLEFYSKYKHLYIPANYITEDEIHIGRWLYDRKLEYERNELSEDRRKKLEKLDKTWLEPVNTKSSFPEQAVLFYLKKAFPSATKLRTREISEIDIYIPEIKVGVEYDGPSHKSKVAADKKKTQKCKDMGIELIRIRDFSLPIINDESYKIVLQDDTFAALNNGIKKVFNHLKMSDKSFSVDVKRDYIEIADNHIKSIDLNWYLMFDQLKEYKKTHGDINVPIYYKTPKGILLGHWLSNIRSSYKNPKLGNIRLNSYKIELLEELGIDWSPIETQWRQNYNLAKEYYNENGNLLVPDKYITKDNVNLGRWIGTQRYNYKENKLPKMKIELLEKISMIWDVYDYQWKKAYALAEEYFKDKGDLLISNNYISKCGFNLGSWIKKQRQLYIKQQLSKEKINLLGEIGYPSNNSASVN